MTVIMTVTDKLQIKNSVCVCFSLSPSLSKLPQTQMEWAQLLESQQRYHDDELQKWKEIIKSSVMLLDEVRQPISRILMAFA